MTEIKILKDFTVFGMQFHKGSIIATDYFMNSEGSGILVCHYKNKTASISRPIFIRHYTTKPIYQVMDAIVYNNTGHSDFFKWNDWNNHRLFGNKI